VTGVDTRLGSGVPMQIDHITLGFTRNGAETLHADLCEGASAASECEHEDTRYGLTREPADTPLVIDIPGDPDPYIGSGRVVKARIPFTESGSENSD
jgi:hypothetical protein